MAYNLIARGQCLEDIEKIRRQYEAYLKALGVERVPDPTTGIEPAQVLQRLNPR